MTDNPNSSSGTLIAAGDQTMTTLIVAVCQNVITVTSPVGQKVFILITILIPIPIRVPIPIPILILIQMSVLLYLILFDKAMGLLF